MSAKLKKTRKYIPAAFVVEQDKTGFTVYVRGKIVVDGSMFTEDGRIRVAKNTNCSFKRVKRQSLKEIGYRTFELRK